MRFLNILKHIVASFIFLVKKIIRTAYYVYSYNNKIKSKKYSKVEPANKCTYATALEKLNKYGYAIIPNYMSEKDCKYLIKNIDFSLKKFANYVDVDSANSDHRIWGAEKTNQKIYNFYKDKNIRDTASSYMGTNVSPLLILANKVIFKKNNLGSGGGWHRDNYNYEFKAILYLSNVKKNNGPFQLLEKTHTFLSIIKTSIFLNKYHPDTRYSLNEIKKLNYKMKYKRTTINGKAGTMILVNTRLIHRGSPIQKGSRYALTAYCYPEFLKKNYNNKYKVVRIS